MIPHDTRLRRHAPLIVLEVLLVGTLIFEIARENGPAVFLLSALVLAALVPLALEPIARADRRGRPGAHPCGGSNVRVTRTGYSITPHARRLPASPVERVSSSGPSGA